MFRFIIKSAFATLLKRKLRSFLVIFMIASSLWSLMLMQGLYDGMTEQMIQNAIRSDSSQVSIFPKDFRKEKDIKLQIENEKKIYELLDNHTNVKSHISRVTASGLIATAKYSRNAFIYGIDLKDEKNHSTLDKYIYKGEYSFHKKRKGAIIGFKLAQKLKLKLGKKIILSAQDSNNEVSSISLKVRGIIKTNNMSFDEFGVFIDKQKAKEFLAVDHVNQISMMLHKYEQVEILKNSLKKEFKEIEVFDWGELYPALLQSEKIMMYFSYISYATVFLSAALGIFGVMLVSIMERKKELGILQALGTRFKTVALMIFFESFILGMLGLLFGLLLGGLNLYYYNIYGLDLSMYSDALSEFGMESIFYASIRLEYFITAFIAVVSATLLSIVIPLRILKKSKPVEVINE